MLSLAALVLLANDVVFVCEHGSVKSVIAAQWFNRLAAERHMDVRAVARGVSVDAQVPQVIADALAKDGFEVRGFKPASASTQELAEARKVVTFAVDVPGAPAGRATRWEGVPPASEQYDKARDEIRQRVERLLDELQAPARR
jgi:protein-tyrosine-phosphatase